MTFSRAPHSECTIAKFGELPSVNNNEDLFLAAGRLASEGIAYVLSPGRKWGIDLVNHLAAVEPDMGWHGPMIIRKGKGTPRTDLGFHGDSFGPDKVTDAIHYNPIPYGTAEVTFARSRGEYETEADREAVNAQLTELLRDGRTDTRFVDPDSFQRARVADGQAIAYRITDRNTRLPLLHDFRTIGEERGVDWEAILTRDAALRLQRY